MLEKEVKKAVLGELSKLPNSYFYSTPVSRFGISGVADITGILESKAIYIECKTPDAYKTKDLGMSPAQKRFAESVWSGLGLYIVVDSVARLKEELGELGLLKNTERS